MYSLCRCKYFDDVIQLLIYLDMSNVFTVFMTGFNQITTVKSVHKSNFLKTGHFKRNNCENKCVI